MSDPTLAQIWKASQVCDSCGCAWGKIPKSSQLINKWHGICHLCELELDVAHVRHYGHLIRGVAIIEKRNYAQ